MDEADNVLRFARTALVLKQPLLVALFIGFVLVLLVLRFSGGPDEPAAPLGPRPLWVWPLWALMLAALALGGWLLCHGEEITIDGARRQVTQSHRFLNRELTRNQWSFKDFTGVWVVLKIDSEHRGTSMPTGGSTLSSARTVTTRRYLLQLSRPDHVLVTPDKTLTAPAYPLDLPLPEAGDPRVVEATARRLTRLGGWPATRRHYTLVDQDPARIRVVAGGEQALPPD